jgi:hypothetical protein
VKFLYGSISDQQRRSVMPQTSELLKSKFDGEPRPEPDIEEAISTFDRRPAPFDRIQWNVELAREWAFLGGD